MRKILETKSKNFDSEFQKVLKKRKSSNIEIEKVVQKILKDVKKNSDKAVIKYTKSLDNFNIDSFNQLKVTNIEINKAFRITSNQLINAIKVAYQRIKNYHKRQLPKDDFYKDKQGVFLGSKWNPISSVGLYVPGGTASYPSSVLMNAIPAIVAGVKRIVMVVPTQRGKINPSILAVAKVLGINEIYKIGGAQAIGALAYGTESLEKVDKICGPGNAYVASAKKNVFGMVGIDMIAGPSEILVVADERNNAKHIAIDLLSQAEHDELAQSILITTSRIFAEKVNNEINVELKKLSRVEIAKKSWNDFGRIIVAKNINECIHLINLIAPEHLELTMKNANVMLKKINNAGAIFLGKHTPEAIGDYIAGPNHVLPTDRTSKFSSGLNVLDFMKRTSVVRCDLKSLKKIGPDAIILAEEEGLGAHALSISTRIQKK
tara:strand:- start:955 stop:2253 length:1299 start_codon:yes stop_codon:yes gene_type:complete